MLDNGKEPWLDFDSYRLHRRRRILEKNGEHMRLTPRVFDLLALLVENAGEVVTKEELLEKVWADTVVEEGNINRTVSTLRKHLGKQSDGTDFIETVPRVGYRFLADVKHEPDSPPAIASNGDNQVKPAVLVVPETHPAEKKNRTYLWFGAVFIGVITIGFLGWNLWPRATPTPATSTKNIMVKVLDTPSSEIAPVFTNDGRIRFGSRQPDKTYKAFTMAADGTDVRPENVVSDMSYGRWSPDGTKVFFNRTNDKRFYLANADGSDERVMPFSPGNAMWSPDSKAYLYQATAPNSTVPNNADLYLYSIETGISTPVVEGPAFDADPAFAPDGKSIAYISDREGNFEVYVLNLETKETRRLTDNPAHDAFPTFSPDGTQIVFDSDREKENSDVYLMNVDGSGIRKITDGPGWEAVPGNPWSPDGTKIVLLCDADGDEDIYVMEVEPFEPHKIFEEDLEGPTFPSYSPDGNSIVYQSKSGLDSAIRIYDSATKASRLVTVAGGTEAYPSFSPDGSKILFQEKTGDNTEICVINTDGNGQTNLSQNQAKDIHPSFSPDGKTIVFSTNRSGSSPLHEIYVMNADGSDQRQVYGDRAMSIYPVFSPSGSTIFFSNDREGGRIGNFELFSVAAAGGAETRLTNRRRGDAQPSISPDGKRIAFASSADGNDEIYVMNVDGTNLLRLTRDLAQDNCPRWSPDGKRIIFSSDRRGKSGVYEMVLTD